MQLNNIIKFKSPADSTQNPTSIKPAVTKSEFTGEKISRIHADTVIQGNLKSNDSLFFSGKMVGEIRINNKLVLGESADIKGNIYALNLIILGKVEGEIFIEGKVILGDKSVFRGKISAKTIEVKKGAILNADCIVKSSVESPGELAVQLQGDPLDQWKGEISW